MDIKETRQRLLRLKQQHEILLNHLADLEVKIYHIEEGLRHEVLSENPIQLN